MSRFVLRPRDGAIPYQKITTGREWVGRVLKHATEPHYVATMNGGKVTATGATAVAAFEAVVAKHLGFGSAAAMRQRNAVARAVQRGADVLADRVADAFNRGDTKAIEPLLDSPQGGMLLLRGLTRSLRRSARRR